MMLGAAGTAAGQPTSAVDHTTISGRVIDAHGKPVARAQVTLDAPPQRAPTITDAEGRYAIADVAIGAGIIVVADQRAGLGTATGAQVDDIVLLGEAQAAETITIESEGAPSAQGAAKLGRRDLQRIPGTGNDVMRALQAMPGVASYPLPIGSSGVVIRGSSPQDSKLLIDDFEVPSLYHDLGFRSIVPAEAIESLEYVPGGFDVAYGRAASGIVNLTTRPGRAGTSEQAEVSGSDASVLAQGSLGDTERGAYMVAFRRSVIDMLLPSLIPADADLSLTTVPRYYDEQLRVDYTLSSAWKLRVSSLGSDDALELYASRDRNPDKRFLNRTRFVRVTSAATYHDGAWTANLALSGIAQQFVFERGELQHLSVATPAVTARAELLRTAPSAAGLTELAWRVGAEAVVSDSTIDLAMPIEHREGEPAATDNAMDTSTKFRGTIASTDLATWTALAANLDPRIRVTAGMRVDAFTRVHDVAVQPRGELAIKLHRTLTARLSAGAYSRPPEHQTELLDASLRSERSRQVIAGLGFEPREGLRVQGSVYYTDRDHLITRQMSGALANDGRGTTYGAELLGTLNTGPVFAWLSYAYSHSTRIDSPGAAPRLFDYDQPHSLNAAVSYQLGRVQLGARFRAYSGLPATPVERAIFDSDTNSYEPLYGAVNSERAPIHHQLDVRIDRAWRWGPVKMSNFLDVQNVYMNQSVVGYFYGFDYTQRAAFRSLPILPTAGVRGEF